MGEVNCNPRILTAKPANLQPTLLVRNAPAPRTRVDRDKGAVIGPVPRSDIQDRVHFAVDPDHQARTIFASRTITKGHVSHPIFTNTRSLEIRPVATTTRSCAALILARGEEDNECEEYEQNPSKN